MKHSSLNPCWVRSCCRTCVNSKTRDFYIQYIFQFLNTEVFTKHYPACRLPFCQSPFHFQRAPMWEAHRHWSGWQGLDTFQCLSLPAITHTEHSVSLINIEKPHPQYPQLYTQELNWTQLTTRILSFKAPPTSPRIGTMSWHGPHLHTHPTHLSFEKNRKFKRMEDVR